MGRFENKKMAEMVAYILNKTGGADFYHVFKILYFAEMLHLAEWGLTFVPDEFRALQYGPVPSNLYDAVKELAYPKSELAQNLYEVALMGDADAKHIMFPKRSADISYLSESEIEAINASIDQNEHLSFSELMKKSHDSAWEEAFYKKHGTNRISRISMAEVLGADPAVLEYIHEQLELETALMG